MCSRMTGSIPSGSTCGCLALGLGLISQAGRFHTSMVPRNSLIADREIGTTTQSLTWKIASISTAIPAGNATMPTALRVPTPASPKTSFIRSE